MTDGHDAFGPSRAADLFRQFIANGEGTIHKFIEEEISEELFVDYKRATNDGAAWRLEQADKENFARAICGFANSEGGLIIWGVDCRHDNNRGDVPTSTHPIQRVKRFLSFLEGATSGCTLPPHDGVRHHVIQMAGSEAGFVVTFVPKSMFAPHQCTVGKYRDRYYVRVGSNFEMAPHGLLAGMFGRQPTPNVFHMWGCGGKTTPGDWGNLITWVPTSTPYVWLQPTIRNHGVVVVRDVYVNFMFSIPGPNCRADMTNKDQSFNFWESVGGWHLISNDQYRLPPSGMVAPFALTLYLKPPFESPLDYELSFGCSGSPVHRVLATASADEVGAAYATYTANDRSRQAGFDLAKVLFDLERRQDYYKDVEL